MLKFKSRAEFDNEQQKKNRQPFIIQSVSEVNFKSKYLSERLDGIQSTPKVKSYFNFKDISNGEKAD